MCDWVCYCLVSLDANKTYIGATNNMEKRLSSHNSKLKSRKGAKYTGYNTWIVAIMISGFSTKNSCLSFESGWKKISKTRNNKKLCTLNMLSENYYLKYTKDTLNNRVIDLVYFLNYSISNGMKYIMSPTKLITTSNSLEIGFINNNILLPWPFYVSTYVF